MFMKVLTPVLKYVAPITQNCSADAIYFMEERDAKFIYENLQIK
jgi:hypothetical protein